MSTVTRGVKRRCASCDTAFYDLNRSPIVCPKCGKATRVRMMIINDAKMRVCTHCNAEL